MPPLTLLSSQQPRSTQPPAQPAQQTNTASTMAKLIICLTAVLLCCAAAIAAAESAEKPVRALFVSCPACKLRRMPELRTFLKDVSRNAPYGDAVTVEYKRGATPILHLFGENDKELSQTAVDNWTAAELDAALMSHGFAKIEASPATYDEADGKAQF